MKSNLPPEHFLHCKRFTPADLDALALRAAAGDLRAEAEALQGVTALVIKLVGKVVGRCHLEARREELLQEGMLAATKFIRRFDGRVRLVTYLGKCVLGKVSQAARQFFSPSGARVKTCGALDFSEPIFLGTVRLTGEPMEESILPPARQEEARETLRETRLRLMKRLQRLTALEREVVLRRWGVPQGRASRDRYAKARWANVRPESLDTIGADHGVSGEAIRKIQLSALCKLGIEIRPTDSRA